MKRPTFLLALLCLFFTFSSAQESTIPLQEQLDEAVSTLDLSQVPSGLLTDKIHTLVDLSVFDGVSVHDSNWTIRPIYEMLYLDLQSAACSPVLPLPPLEEMLDSLDNTAPGAPIPLSLLLFKYDKFKSDAIAQGLITHTENHFYDVPNRPASPYISDTLFATNLGQDQANQLHLRFHLRADLMYSNIDSTIEQLDIDFDDGQGWQSYTTGSIISIPYTTEGLKRIYTRYTTTGGHPLLAQSLLYIELPEEDGGLRLYSDLPDGTIEIEGGLTGHIYYNNDCAEKKLIKPFIILEGFDPNGKTSFTEFRRLVDEKYKLPSGQRLIDDFHAGGYDLIFVNFHDGADHIQTNAQHVKALIEEINSRKGAAGSTEENVILGVSMGGVVGKWALREMELAPYQNHECRQFITLDAPMRGANIAPALQALVFALGNHKFGGIKALKDFKTKDKDGNKVDNGLKKGINSISSPAAKELIYYHIDNLENISQWHDEFYAQLDALGDLEVEHVALANGSQIGEGQVFGAGDLLLDNVLLTNSILSNSLGEKWKQILKEAGIAITGSGLVYKIKAWALPGDDNTIFKGTFIDHILGAPYVEKIKIDVPEGLLSLDSAPGGNRPFNRVEPGENSLDFGWKHGGFCFVPTFSALDIKVDDPDFDLSNPIAVLASSSTPIQSYVGSNQALFRWNEADISDDVPNPDQHNQEHALLNRRLATFLVYNLVGNSELAALAEPGVLNSTYNFGSGNPLYNPGLGNSVPSNFTTRSTRHEIDKLLTVRGSGQLWVNRAGRIAYIDSLTNAVNDSSPFDVYIRKDCQSPIQVIVRSGGRVHIGQDARTGQLIVEDGNSLWIREGGEVIVEDGSQITIKSGATLTLGAGSRLTVKQGGKVLIEPGGKLNIYESSTIDLQDAPSNIHVQGWMVVKGTFDFPGKGFFQFDPENVFIAESEFILEGRGKGERFIRLNEDAVLNIGGGKITLRNGAVTYRDDSSIKLEAGGEASLWYTEFSGKGIGLRAVGAQKVLARDCDFMGLNDGLVLQNMSQANQQITLLLSNFYSCQRGITAYQCHTLDVSNCQFFGDEQGQTGIYAEAVGLVDLMASTIDGFNQPGRAGVELINTPTLSMSGGVIRNCYHGIYSPYYDSPAANISLSSFATLQDNSFGITIERGGFTGGAVSMNCARLINNTGAGIAGTDITLHIDACNNAGDPNCSGNFKPNHFEAGIGDPSQNHLGLFFDICYEALQITTVPAKGNYWAWNGHPHANPRYLLGYSGNSGICNNGVTLDDSESQVEAPANCSGIITPPGGDGVGMFTGSTSTDRLGSEAGERSEQTLASSQKSLKVFPNPSSDRFQVQLPEGQYQLQVIDATGKIIWSGNVENNHFFSASDWPVGIYLITAKMPEEHFLYQKVLKF